MPIALAALAIVLAQADALAAPPPATRPPAAKSATADVTVEGVVVTGAAAELQTSIDRRSYSLGKDVQGASGSIADALRNLPSVEVDLQGRLSLRGDANVTVLVDGKPSAAFEGAGRADALQQLPADQYERVEVITTPSAAMNPDGSGGVINLITKQSRGSGWTGSTYVTAGSAGLKRVGATFGYNSKALNVTGSLSGNYQHNKSALELERSTLDAASGLFSDHRIDLIGRNLNRGPSARLTVGYALTPKDQLTANASYNQVMVYGDPYNRFTDFDRMGSVTGLLERQGHRRMSSADNGLSGGWRHSFAGEGHQLSVDLISNGSQYDDDLLYRTLRSTPPTAQPLELNVLRFTTRHSEFKVTYSRPLPQGAKLVTGYELKYDDNQFAAGVLRGPTVAGLMREPGLSYEYDYRQTLNAVYATYEKTVGDLGLQAGVRVEDARLDLKERVTQAGSRPDYFRAYPSLHLTYTLDDRTKLRASYSSRVQRPPPFLLNPFRIYLDPKNYQQGNPDLRPQDTQSFEATYEKRRNGAVYQAVAYYRRNEGEFSPVNRNLGDGAVVVTFDNLGSSRSAGLELTANGKLAKTLTYSANSNLFWSQINASNLGVAGERSAYGLSGRLNLNWQATPGDLLQLNASAQGKRLYAQGEAQPNWTVNLGWRRKLTDRVTATLSVQDLLKTNRFRRFAEAPIREQLELTPVSRAILVRLDYRFGGANAAKPADPAFDYGAPAGP